MLGLLHSGPFRVIRPAPAVFGVEGVVQGVERLPPARRRDAEAPACPPPRPARGVSLFHRHNVTNKGYVGRGKALSPGGDAR